MPASVVVDLIATDNWNIVPSFCNPAMKLPPKRRQFEFNLHTIKNQSSNTFSVVFVWHERQRFEAVGFASVQRTKTMDRRRRYFVIVQIGVFGRGLLVIGY
jgi:hypothetical protein